MGLGLGLGSGSGFGFGLDARAVAPAQVVQALGPCVARVAHYCEHRCALCGVGAPIGRVGVRVRAWVGAPAESPRRLEIALGRYALRAPPSVASVVVCACVQRTYHHPECDGIGHYGYTYYATGVTCRPSRMQRCGRPRCCPPGRGGRSAPGLGLGLGFRGQVGRRLCREE